MICVVVAVALVSVVRECSSLGVVCDTTLNTEIVDGVTQATKTQFYGLDGDVLHHTFSKYVGERKDEKKFGIQIDIFPGLFVLFFFHLDKQEFWIQNLEEAGVPITDTELRVVAPVPKFAFEEIPGDSAQIEVTLAATGVMSMQEAVGKGKAFIFETLLGNAKFLKRVLTHSSVREAHYLFNGILSGNAVGTFLLMAVNFVE